MQLGNGSRREHEGDEGLASQVREGEGVVSKLLSEEKEQRED